MRLSKLEKQKVSILDQAFWDKFGDHREPPLASTSHVLHLCQLHLDNEVWLYNRKAGTGGVKSLAKATVCWMLEQELIKSNEDNWIDGSPWRITTYELHNWWAIEPEMEEFFQPIMDALCEDIRAYRAELKQWIKENRK